MLKQIRIAYVGFGVVSQGLAEILIKNNNRLPDQTKVKTVGIIDFIKGSMLDENGIDMKSLMVRARLNDYSLLSEKVNDTSETIKNLGADIIIEASYTNIKTGEPAISHIEAALNFKKHVVTSNKGPFAIAYKKIFDLAARAEKNVAIEGTVMSGTPIINVLNNGLLGSDIQSVSGVMNGTSNFILCQMEGGMPYTTALAKAQEEGYAEADPTSDVEGFDTLAKVMILANVIFDCQLNMDDIKVKGISQISIDDIKTAAEKNRRWKLIGKVWKDKFGKVKGQVSPELVSQTDSLYNITGATNALKITSSILGDTTISGAGAGKIETGFSLYNDIISIVKQTSKLI